MNTITAKSIGCVLDCSCESADTLNARTFKLAVEYGYKATDDDNAILARFDGDAMDGDDSQYLSEMGDDAVSYLNDLDLPAYCSFFFEDNSLFFAPCVENAREDVGFVSSRHQDYPDSDYRGEWLHVSDHGNATLYVRNDDGTDTEIWGVV